MRKKILITGAGGYIGTSLVPMLLEKNYEIIAIDRFFFGEELLADHPNLRKINEDSRKLTKENFSNVDFVIDLVAISNDPSGELFQKATWEINHASRVNTATLAKQAGVKRYILPSSCSVYGFQADGVIADETSKTNPLTTYAKANLKAEEDILPLASSDFAITILRQATVYGYSARMRFDLAINGMSYGAFSNGKLPLMRDGKQWRPMVHVRDTAAAMCYMLEAEFSKINGEIFNIGSEENNYQLEPLAKIVADTVPKEVKIEFYGDVDHRSYRVSFKKLEDLGFKARYKAEDGVREICQKLAAKELEKTDKTITLKWYQNLVEWNKIINQVNKYEGIVDIA